MIDKVLYNKLKEKYGNEMVFVVPFDAIANTIPDGYTQKEFIKSSDMLASLGAKGNFIFRYDAEYNTAFQQLIPYTMVFNNNYSKIYVAKRIAGDARLVESYSLGFGGHINTCDLKDVRTTLWLNAAKRELDEELDIVNPSEPIFNGYIRDLKSETSEHIGLLYSITCDDVKVKETDCLVGEWMAIDEILDKYTKFESWSKMLIDHMFMNNKEYSKLWTVNKGGK